MNEKTASLLETLGSRLKLIRLNANYTQKELAEIIGISRTAIEGAEKGKCNLATFVSILVALGADEQIDSFLPDLPPSPVLLAKTLGKKRQRASAAKKRGINITNSKDDLGW